MRALFVVQDYPSLPGAADGAGQLIFGHLDCLLHACESVVLVQLSNTNDPKGFTESIVKQPEAWQELRSRIRDHRTLEYRPVGVPPYRKLWQIVADPAAFTNSVLTADNAAALKDIVKGTRPDIIWADERMAGMLAVRASLGVPVIYSHLDWGWRIMLLRMHGRSIPVSLRLRSGLLRRAEVRLVRTAAACVSGSVVEAAEIKRLGAKIAEYLPAIYEPTQIEEGDGSSELPRLVHLGGMASTANRVGLKRFLQVVWPALVRTLNPSPEFWIVGSLSGADGDLQHLIRQAGAIATGFVDDLSTVLRPYDVHIMPWEHNTGTRTRIPLIFSYAQAVVAVRAGVSCIPEVENEDNALVVDEIGDMAKAISRLCAQRDLRKKIGLAARKTFVESFTREAVQPRFNALLDKVIGTAQR